MKQTQSMTRFSLMMLILVSTFLFSSCREDKDPECLPGLDSPAVSSLGEYTGILTVNGSLVNGSGTATLTETGCKTYSLSFSNDVASITNIGFISSNGTFVYVADMATTTVTLLANGNLTVSKTMAPVIAFTGSK